MTIFILLDHTTTESMPNCADTAARCELLGSNVTTTDVSTRRRSANVGWDIFRDIPVFYGVLWQNEAGVSFVENHAWIGAFSDEANLLFLPLLCLKMQR